MRGYSKIEMIRAEILDTAKKIVTTDRNAQYGEPEDNFDTIASLWNAYLVGKHSDGAVITAKDVALMMVLFKVGRILTSTTVKEDSYIDAAGYIACGYECAQKEAERERRLEAAMKHISEMHNAHDM